MRSTTRMKGKTIVRATGLVGLLGFLPLTLKVGEKSGVSPVGLEVREACASGACCVQIGSICAQGGAMNHIYKAGGCPLP